MMNKIIKSQMKIIQVHEGDVLHGMAVTDNGFSGFGEAYFSTVNPGAIKGWKRHKTMICNFLVPVGTLKVVVYDDVNNKFDENILSRSNYLRLTISPKLWIAFQCLDVRASVLLNIANIAHDPNEADSRDLESIEYNWTA